MNAIPFQGTIEVWRSPEGDLRELVSNLTIAAPDVTGTNAAQLGHANGYPLVQALGADALVELVSAVLVYNRVTATYGAGGNLTINLAGGGAALTGLISAGNSVGAASDKVCQFNPLAAAAIIPVLNTGLNLVSSVAFTNPGTAAGVVRVRIRYRVHQLGLS